MQVTREVALTEVWLDERARLSDPVFPRVSARTWLSEIGKAFVWFVGLALVLVLLCLLAPESRADSVDVTSYLEANSSLPLATGVAGELANNLLLAQSEAWGNVWQTGSLVASEDAVLKAITLYVWPGGPESITDTCCLVVWEQSHVAIDTRLTVSLDPPAVDLGSQPVPEPGTWAMLGIGLLVLRWSFRRTVADRMRKRLESYRRIRLV